VALVGYLVAEGGTEFGTAKVYCRMGRWTGFWWVFRDVTV
jgi:hypothetical protein